MKKLHLFNPQPRQVQERYEILYNMPSKKIKIGIKCSIAKLDSPQKTNNANERHWRYFFIIYIILGFQKKSKQAISVRFQSLTAHQKTP